ncbi:ester cyclase [Streptomyces mayteni]
MTTSQAASNRAMLNRLHHTVNSGDLTAIKEMIDEVIAPDVLFHAPVPMRETGPRALAQVWETLLRAFPDLQVRVEDVIAEGDRVAIRNTVSGTHRGEYRGLPPTGRTVSYGEMFVFRFVDGRVAEIWGVVDVLAQLRQLGALPDGPAA